MSPSDIDNGKRLPVATPFFTGEAGVLAGERGGRFAALMEGPPRSRAGDASVDGRPITITSVNPTGTIAGMTVVDFAWDEERN